MTMNLKPIGKLSDDKTVYVVISDNGMCNVFGNIKWATIYINEILVNHIKYSSLIYHFKTKQSLSFDKQGVTIYSRKINQVCF